MKKKNIFKTITMAMLFIMLFANISFADDSILIDFSKSDYINGNDTTATNDNTQEGMNISIKIKKDNDNNFSYAIGTSNDYKPIKTVNQKDVPTVDNSGTFKCYMIPIEYNGPDNIIKNMSEYDLADSNGVRIDDRGKNMYYDELGNKFIIMKNGQYYIQVPIEAFIADDTISIIFNFTGQTEIPSTRKTNKDVVNGAEILITRAFLAIGAVFLGGIRFALGPDLSIDSLIFNRFEGTKISFFGGETSDLNNVLINVVNYWYKALSNFTTALYVIILLYIGIMIITSSGTPRQDKAKAYFGDWVVGLLILAFLPYFVFPMLFKINDAIVEYVGRGSPTFQTYYNLEEKYGVDEIKGGDSYTILVKKIEAELDKAKLLQSEAEQTSNSTLNLSINSIVTEIGQKYRQRSGKSDYTTLSKARNNLKFQIMNKLSKKYNTLRNEGKSKEEAMTELKKQINQDIDFSNIDRDTSEMLHDMVIDLKSSYFEELIEVFEQSYLSGELVSEIEEDLASVGKDIMGIMRSRAGETLRLIYAIIWLMLIFQLVGLTILYYKRVFVIAILIAIFPLVMLTYCIDKMADGAAQTFSAWMKEFLSNIFIQTVHAVIYAVLIDMGLQIYDGGEENWLFLVGAMFLLLPAETIMKEIFDLNGSTLSQIGGTFSKVAMGTGALISLAKAGKSEKDKSIKTANDNRMKRLQNSQNRADMKAKTREFKSTYDWKYRTDEKGNRTKVYTPVKGGKPEGIREGLYHGTTAARKAYAKAAPKIGRTIRGVRNVTAVTAGALYAASGGDVQSLAQGAALAKSLSGKTTNAKKKADLKTELKSAYERKK